MRYIFPISALLVSIVFTGCGAKGQQFTNFNTPKADKGLIYVYRPSSFVGGGVFYDIHTTTKSNPDLIAGELVNGGFVEIDAPIGEVEVWGKTESKSSVTIDVKNQSIQCVKGGVGLGFVVGRPNLTIVDMETCKNEIKDTRRAQ